MQHQPPPTHHPMNQLGQPRMTCPRTAQIGIPLNRPPGPQNMLAPPGGGGGGSAIVPPYMHQPPHPAAAAALQCFPQRPLFQHFHPATAHHQGGIVGISRIFIMFHIFS